MNIIIWCFLVDDFFYSENSYIHPNVKMSLQTRKSDFKCTFSRFFRKVRGSLDLWNKVPIFVSDIWEIPLI